MARYIDADDFLDLFYVASIGQDKEFVKTVEMVVADTPTEDVQKVKHGYWEDDEYMYICNICGKWLDITQGTADMNYCPNCGAKMDGGDTV